MGERRQPIINGAFRQTQGKVAGGREGRAATAWHGSRLRFIPASAALGILMRRASTQVT